MGDWVRELQIQMVIALDKILVYYFNSINYE